jgi:hypothetical protein
MASVSSPLDMTKVLPPFTGAGFGEAPDGGLLVGGDQGLFRLVKNHFEKVPLPGAPPVTWMGGVKIEGKRMSLQIAD